MFDIVYADPPWRFETWSDKGAGRSPDAHYSTMTTDDIASLPVQSIVADNSILFMWATFPRLPDALCVGEAWGFEYITAGFVWAKTQPKKHRQAVFVPALDDKLWFMGMGYYTRANAELCLLFRRGDPLTRKRKDIRQLVIEPKEEHSKKPDVIYDKIESLFDGNKIELFARQKRAGWTSLGNEIDGRDIRDSLIELSGELNEQGQN